ncbi:MAG: 4-alpha-glucanotransferase [Planctomycetota bacterium]
MWLKIGPETCAHYAAALNKEWLETNGRGGFAAGTVAGPFTRRYHGWLIPALQPPVQRRALLSGCDDELVLPDRRVPMAAHEFPGVIHPDGHRFLVEFRLDPWPVWVWQVGGVRVERELFLPYGTDSVVVRYRQWGGGPDARFELTPRLAYRDYHALAHAHDHIRSEPERAGEGLVFRPYEGMPALYVNPAAYAFESRPEWRRRYQYRIERDRGLDSEEDQFVPGVLKLQAAGDGIWTGFVAGLEAVPFARAEGLAQAERKRRTALADSIPGADAHTQRLLLAADQFIVQRGAGGRTVIAGYPWFGDWGRDTLIALPGLCIATGRLPEARAILKTFAQHIDAGMIPNRFPDESEAPEYNTIDAAPWYFHAVHAYFEASNDEAFLKETFPVLEAMVAAHEEGTRYGIKVDDDGLLRGGHAGVQLTWMDAKVGDWVVTPRIGKPVEINALWYNALCHMRDFAQRLKQQAKARAYDSAAARVKTAFAKFWNAERGCLYDVLEDGGRPDGALRPNQLFALSLPHRLLDSNQERAVLDVVTRELLTPMGLRSLEPRDRAYVPHYGGGPLQRDGSYHQGTVWGWLIGPYIDACLNVHGTGARNVEHLKKLLDPLLGHLDQDGLGSVSEIFDAEAPHAPRGCFAQAWSVAELLRAWRRLHETNAGSRAG